MIDDDRAYRRSPPPWQRPPRAVRTPESSQFAAARRQRVATAVAAHPDVAKARQAIADAQSQVAGCREAVMVRNDQMFRVHDDLGVSYREIAEWVGVSRQTVILGVASARRNARALSEMGRDEDS